MRLQIQTSFDIGSREIGGVGGSSSSSSGLNANRRQHGINIHRNTGTLNANMSYAERAINAQHVNLGVDSMSRAICAKSNLNLKTHMDKIIILRVNE
jgi:hypothetical protein